MEKLRIYYRLAAALLFILGYFLIIFLCPLLWFAQIRHRFNHVLPGLIVWSVGIKLHFHRPENKAKGRGLVVANHGNSFDIFILSSLFQHAYGVLKTKIARQPLSGWVARLSGSLFVDREAKTEQTKQEQSQRVEAALHKNIVFLFPEGKMTSMKDIQPFRTRLIRPIIGTDIPLCPVTIALEELDRRLFGRRSHAYDDEGDSFFGNLFRWLGKEKLDVHIVFHNPVHLTSDEWEGQLETVQEKMYRTLMYVKALTLPAEQIEIPEDFF